MTIYSFSGGFVGEEEAGSRLYQVIVDPRCRKSGVYWSWNGGPREGRTESLKTDGQIIGAGGAGGGWDSIFENDQSDKVKDPEQTLRMFQLSTKVRVHHFHVYNVVAATIITTIIFFNIIIIIFLGSS